MQDVLRRKEVPGGVVVPETTTHIPAIINNISSSLLNTLNVNKVPTENVLSIEVGLNADPNSYNGAHDHQQDQIDSLRKEAAKHAGHENQHLAMVLILITVMVISQIILVWWKAKYQKSYIHASMLAMYIIPFGISAYRCWWRFVTIWLVITIITTYLVWKPIMMPTFSKSGSVIPRLLYKWFFVVYSISSVLTFVGYSILMLTFIGINVLVHISPQASLDVGSMMLFYGIYYGVLCRDFTDFLVDKLATQIGYYNPSSSIPSKLLRSDICAICGMEHGERENVDMEDLSKNEPFASDESQSFLEDENVNYKERIFLLTCGHKFHEYCIYGWCLVGKRQVCPFCREKVDLKCLFSALPFQKPHYLYGNLLDLIRYLFAWQPIIFLAVHLIDYMLGLR